MHTCLQKLTLVKNKVNEIINQKQLKTNPKIIVVTKTFSLDKIAFEAINFSIDILSHLQKDFITNKIPQSNFVFPIIDKKLKGENRPRPNNFKLSEKEESEDDTWCIGVYGPESKKRFISNKTLCRCDFRPGFIPAHPSYYSSTSKTK